MFAVIVTGLVVYLVVVGLEKADKVASSIGAVLALIALGAPYLFPRAGGNTAIAESDLVEAEPDLVEDSGRGTAVAGGFINTGVDAAEGDERPAQVRRSGDASADGRGSVANTGVLRRPRS